MKRLAVVLLALGLLAFPLAVPAQPSTKVPRIGFLGPGSAGEWPDTMASFRDGLRELGYIEGQNVSIEWRFAGKYEQLPTAAMELVALNPDVIVTVTTPAAQAAKKATSAIPIVMSGVSDPVELGLVSSMSRPGGNATGITNNPGSDFSAKQLQLLKEAAPQVSRVAVLTTSHVSAEAAHFDALQVAGRTLNVTLVSVKVESPSEFPLATLVQARPDALYVFPNGMNWAHRAQILEFAARNRLPSMHGEKDWVAAGGLMSYNADWQAMRRRAAAFVDKILKGAKPADLPVEGPTRFDLVVNLKTAKALGLTIPQSVLLRADEVIQ
jgi:putative ABC transport system substrate-binding protein